MLPQGRLVKLSIGGWGRSWEYRRLSTKLRSSCPVAPAAEKERALAEPLFGGMLRQHNQYGQSQQSGKAKRTARQDQIFVPQPPPDKVGGTDEKSPLFRRAASVIFGGT
jgi:hypothetical protein